MRAVPLAAAAPAASADACDGLPPPPSLRPGSAASLPKQSAAGTPTEMNEPSEPSSVMVRWWRRTATRTAGREAAGKAAGKGEEGRERRVAFVPFRASWRVGAAGPGVMPPETSRGQAQAAAGVISANEAARPWDRGLVLLLWRTVGWGECGQGRWRQDRGRRRFRVARLQGWTGGGRRWRAGGAWVEARGQNRPHFWRRGHASNEAIRLNGMFETCPCRAPRQSEATCERQPSAWRQAERDRMPARAP